MTTVTLRIPVTGVPGETAKPARPGFWRRMFDRMVEARMRRAEAEIAYYRSRIPTDHVADAGYRVGIMDAGRLPFVR